MFEKQLFHLFIIVENLFWRNHGFGYVVIYTVSAQPKIIYFNTNTQISLYKTQSHVTTNHNIRVIEYQQL